MGLRVDEEGQRRLGRDGKGREWHTAFYCLAESLRVLSRGAVNHKVLYSLVGIDGRYVNHANPLVRKRTAGALSRIVHTSRYASDMRTRYTQDHGVFDRAATTLCDTVLAKTGEDEPWLRDELRDSCWPKVREGLLNERGAGRGDIDLFRIDCEAALLFGAPPASPTLPARDVLAAILHIMAFCHVDLMSARALVDNIPTVDADASVTPSVTYQQTGACLARFADASRTSVCGLWHVSMDHPFSIGRYTDCDIVEADGCLSRMHCLVYHTTGGWFFEDMASRNGSIVLRDDGSVAFDSARDGTRVPVALRYGDVITLAQHSYYWFGATCEAEGPALASGARTPKAAVS